MPLPLAIPLIATGLQVGGQIYGQIQANKAQQKNDAFLTQRRNDLAAKFNTSQNEDYLDTDAARGALEQVRKNMKEVSKATANAAVQGGSTPEAVIATQGKLQSKYQDAVTGLLTVGQQRRDRDKYLYENLGMGLDNLQAGNLAGKVAQWGTFSNNVNSAAGGIMNAWANGSFEKPGEGSGGMIGSTKGMLQGKDTSGNIVYN
jgi:hypothetical protein